MGQGQSWSLTNKELIAIMDTMKQISILFCLILFFLISCNNQAEPVKTQAPAPGTEKTTEPPKQASPQAVEAEPSGLPQVVQTEQETAEGISPAPLFDPASISQEEKDTAKTEIQQLIQRLNSIIRARNYNAWVTYLDTNYFTVISSPEYLDRISQSAVLVKQKIVLKSAQDYFRHVVVPARTNDRVDDIEFISQNRVKAYTVNSRGERLRLYDLEKTGNEWKIIN